QGMAAARQGKHLLIEKPLDIRTERIDELIESAERAGVRLGVFLQERAAADMQRVKGMLEERKAGKGLMATAELLWRRDPEYYADSRWRGSWALDGGGALMNQGIHTVDLLLWFFGPVSKVSAFCRTQEHQIEAEDTVTAILEFRSGPVAALSVTTTAFPGLPRRITIVGDGGTIQIEGSNLKSFYKRGASPEITEKRTDSQRQDSPRVSDAEGHRIVLQDFIEALEQGREPLCNGAEGRKSVEIVEAIYEASRTGNVVKLRR
ncbi:MAG TPA: Gfo/Idh/MocA family oxidoreductase, partial [Acidobacteriota bacterium]|nr:Gfo/Idh/MocA family oxidoreductase [Acidobacteriota bacterium]